VVNWHACVNGRARGQCSDSTVEDLHHTVWRAFHVIGGKSNELRQRRRRTDETSSKAPSSRPKNSLRKEEVGTADEQSLETRPGKGLAIPAMFSRPKSPTNSSDEATVKGAGREDWHHPTNAPITGPEENFCRLPLTVGRSYAYERLPPTLSGRRRRQPLQRVISASDCLARHIIVLRRDPARCSTKVPESLYLY
jgi:hypothetical protein